MRRLPAAHAKRGGAGAMRRILSPACSTITSVSYLPENPMDKKPLDPAILKRIHDMTREAGDNNVPRDDRDAAVAEPKSLSKQQTEAARLTSLYARLTNGRECELRPGMLAVWKPGLKNKLVPAYGQPTIVVEKLDVPIFDPDRDGGSCYFREPLNLLLAVIEKDGDFIVWHFDARRFEPWEGDR
jgi:hypothetical protein